MPPQLDYDRTTVEPYLRAAIADHANAEELGFDAFAVAATVVQLNRTLGHLRMAQQERANDPAADVTGIIDGAVEQEAVTLELALQAVRSLQSDARTAFGGTTPAAPEPAPVPAAPEPAARRRPPRPDADGGQPVHEPPPAG